jgi:hypothetical protein
MVIMVLAGNKCCVAKKLKSSAKSVWGKIKNVIKPETKTMTINCCPN